MKPNQLHMNTKLLFIFLRKVFCYLKNFKPICNCFEVIISRLMVLQTTAARILSIGYRLILFFNEFLGRFP